MNTTQKTLPWLVALIAMSFAGASTAIAAPVITAHAVKKIAKKQATKVVASSASTLSVGHASQADIGLSPVAYATVLADGTIMPGHSRGISQANIDAQGAGGYCFRNLPFQFRSAQTTPIFESGGQDKSAQVSFTQDYPTLYQDCGDGFQVEVATVSDSSYLNMPFIIWFYN